MSGQSTVYIVDDDHSVRTSLSLLLEAEGFKVRAHESGEAFLDGYDDRNHGCVILDLRLPGMNGLELQAELLRRGSCLPILFLSGYGDVPATVRAIKAGAEDFLLKPPDTKFLVDRVRLLVDKSHQLCGRAKEADELRARLSLLSPREREILEYALIGLSSKEIANKLALSQRTVENHRLRINKKLDASNLLEFFHRASSVGVSLLE